MIVKIRKVIFVDELLEMTPEEYCYNRADTTNLKNGNDNCQITDIRPLAKEDENELLDYYFRNKK